MAYSSVGAGGGGLHDDISSGCTIDSLPRTSISSSQYVAPYPYDVEVQTSKNRGSAGRSSSSGVYGGVRSFLSRALKEVHFTASGQERDSRQFPPERPKRPDKNLQSLCRLTQLTKEELKKFYRAFKQECPLGAAEPKHFRYILNKYFPLGDCSSYAYCLFNAFDPQRKGYLTFEEMVLAISSLSRGTLTDKLRWVFTMYDANGDGLIHRSEIRHVILAAYRLGGHYHPGGPPTLKRPTTFSAPTTLASHNQQMEQIINQQTDKIFQKLDVNRDGAVTMETFLQVCLQDANMVASIERLSSDLA